MNILSNELALIDAVQNVLEQMCFMSLVAEPKVYAGLDDGASRLSHAPEDESKQKFGKQVVFSGPFSGSMYLYFSLSLAYALTANLLGLEVEAVQDHGVSDALGEISNMVCGFMLGALDGRQSFELQTPVDVGPPPAGASFTCLFHTEEGLLLGSLFLGDVKQ